MGQNFSTLKPPNVSSFSLDICEYPQLLALIINDLTCYSSVLLHLLPPREPLIIVLQRCHHVDHGTVHLGFNTMRKLLFQLKLFVRRIIIPPRWFHGQRIPWAASTSTLCQWLHGGQYCCSDLGFMPAHTKGHFRCVLALSFFCCPTDISSSFQDTVPTVVPTTAMPCHSTTSTQSLV